jgi:hypothetical protein
MLGVYIVDPSELEESGGVFQVDGGSAIPVWGHEGDIPNGVIGGPVIPVYLVPDEELEINGGNRKVLRGGFLYVVDLTGSRDVVGRVALPVYVVNGGSLGGSATLFQAASVGDVDQTTIVTDFNGILHSPSGDYAGGVTIRINGNAVGIVSATLQPDQRSVIYVIDTPVLIADSVTWEYDKDAGDLQSGGGTPTPDIIPTTVTNLVGTHFWFDTTEDSGHIFTAGF